MCNLWWVLKVNEKQCEGTVKGKKGMAMAAGIYAMEWKWSRPGPAQTQWCACSQVPTCSSF